MDISAKLREIDEVIEKGPYNTWESLTDMEMPSWFEKAKFGIFVHWGVFSVPAFANEWYSRCMYDQNDRAYMHHIETYGPHKDFGYKDFIPMFRAEKFDPDEWLDIFKSAGAKYIVPVAEHHDGFQMYASELSEWNAAKMGPQRDVLGELKRAADERNIFFAASSHRAEHYWFLGVGRHFESDIKGEFERGHIYWPSVSTQPDQSDFKSEPMASEEFLEDWLLRTVEIIDRFRPRILYFDWWVQHISYRETLRKIVAYYYNKGIEWGTPVSVCYKHEALPFGAGIVDVERGKLSDTRPYHWQTDTSIAHNSWCYVDGLDYKSPLELVRYLVDVVAKNGNLLLNIGPKADGSIAEEDKRILAQIGKWLGVNGEAIYNSKPWRISSEGPTLEKEGKFSDERNKAYTCEDYRFTVGNGAVYATVMSYPKDGRCLIKSLAQGDINGTNFQGFIEKVSILGVGEVPFSAETDGLHVLGPVLETEYPVVIKVECFA